MTGSEDSARTYRLAPADRTGALLGLSHASIAVLAVGLVAGVLAFSRGSAPVGLAIAGLCVGLVTIRVDGGPLVETLPTRLGWLRQRWSGRHRWMAPVPLPAEVDTPP